MNNEPTKEIRLWNDIPLNITARVGENRFNFAPPMKCDYGCIRGTWGQGLDRKSLDVYVVGNEPTVHKIIQIKPTGEIDEYKYILGAGDIESATKVFLDHVPRDRFGGIIPYSVGQLQNDVVRYSSVKKHDTNDMNQTNQLIFQLKGLIESDDAYGSAVEILNFNIKPNNDIEGKFKDNWNNRVFSFTILKDKFGYKPAINLAKFDSSEVSDRFDAFSQGYLFLEREDGKPRTVKSKCTAVSYSCGKSCIQLQKTCWIDDLGKKVNKLHGSESSVSQDRIDKLRALASELRKQPGGGNWSKFGTADLLEAKAKNLEEFKTKKTEIKSEKLSEKDELKRRRETIVSYLKIKPIKLGDLAVDYIENNDTTVSGKRRKELTDSIEKHGTNIIPIVVVKTKTNADMDEADHTVVGGNDWATVAKDMGIDKLYTHSVDADDSKAFSKEMDDLQIGNKHQYNQGTLRGAEPKSTKPTDPIYGSERSKQIQKYLQIKPQTRGDLHTFQLATPDGSKITPEREKQLTESLQKHGTNIIPIIVRPTSKYSDEEEYEVVHGADWVLAARKLGNIDKLLVKSIPMDNDEAEKMRSEMDVLMQIPSKSEKRI